MKINTIGHLVKTNPIQTQFKPNSQDAKMNVNSLITKDYRKKDAFALQKNKPNSNPISENPKLNVTSFITKDYRKNDTFAVQKNKPNSNPISEKPKNERKRFFTKGL